jgi:hypothetical protein
MPHAQDIEQKGPWERQQGRSFLKPPDCQQPASMFFECNWEES